LDNDDLIFENFYFDRLTAKSLRAILTK